MQDMGYVRFNGSVEKTYNEVVRKIDAGSEIVTIGMIPRQKGNELKTKVLSTPHLIVAASTDDRIIVRKMKEKIGTTLLGKQ